MNMMKKSLYAAVTAVIVAGSFVGSSQAKGPTWPNQNPVAPMAEQSRMVRPQQGRMRHMYNGVSRYRPTKRQVAVGLSAAAASGLAIRLAYLYYTGEYKSFGEALRKVSHNDLEYVMQLFKTALSRLQKAYSSTREWFGGPFQSFGNKQLGDEPQSFAPPETELKPKLDEVEREYRAFFNSQRKNYIDAQRRIELEREQRGTVSLMEPQTPITSSSVNIPYDYIDTMRPSPTMEDLSK